MHFIAPESLASQPLSQGEGYYFLLTCTLAIVLCNSFLTVFILYFCVGKEVKSYFLKQQSPHDKYQRELPPFFPRYQYQGEVGRDDGQENITELKK
jgi:hypothetical protein